MLEFCIGLQTLLSLKVRNSFLLIAGFLSRSSPRFGCSKHQKYLRPGLPGCHLQCLLPSCLWHAPSHWFLSSPILKVLRKESPNRVPSHRPFFVFLTIQVANRKRKQKSRQDKAHCVMSSICTAFWRQMWTSSALALSQMKLYDHVQCPTLAGHKQKESSPFVSSAQG